MAVVQKLMAWCEEQQFTTPAKDDFARQIALRFGIDYDAFLTSRMLQIMTPDEAAEVYRSGVDIQLHTHRHRTPANRELFVREIEDNRRQIAAITGQHAIHFCYPSGVYEPVFFPWLRDCGVESATTCVRGFAAPDVDPLLVPRVLDDSNMEPVEFEGVVSGLFA
jgi:peptidoglycan/xylan/chitin deacetylase (PgdA/CDA1 family)